MCIRLLNRVSCDTVLCLAKRKNSVFALLYPNPVFLYTSKFIDGYTNRVGAVLFDEHDWHKSDNDTDKLRDVVVARQPAEQNGDVKARVDIGMSQSKAY